MHSIDTDSNRRYSKLAVLAAMTRHGSLLLPVALLGIIATWTIVRAAEPQAGNNSAPAASRASPRSNSQPVLSPAEATQTEALYQSRCAACHSNPTGRTPPRIHFLALTPQSVF